ncbi:MAG: class I SAM-dependent methyltransferase [Andreesenia angusta]|nr:class I SAM-dependent methyltransferase [Andreesenia angusta]
MLKKFLSNTRKPSESFLGDLMLSGMNRGHDRLSKYAISNFAIKKNDFILDIGCGGGKNIQNLLEYTDNSVWGVDYSEASVKKSKKLNKKNIGKGRVKVLNANVEELPFDSNTFDKITAFETIYFWPNIIENFKEVNRILKPGGRFLVANELMNEKAAKYYMDKIDGMTVYSMNEIKNYMENAEFIDTDIRMNEDNKVIMVIGKKKI